MGGGVGGGNRGSFTYGLLSSPSSQSPLSHPSSFDGNHSVSHEDLTREHMLAALNHPGGVSLTLLLALGKWTENSGTAE